MDTAESSCGDSVADVMIRDLDWIAKLALSEQGRSEMRKMYLQLKVGS